MTRPRLRGGLLVLVLLIGTLTGCASVFGTAGKPAMQVSTVCTTAVKDLWESTGKLNRVAVDAQRNLLAMTAAMQTNDDARLESLTDELVSVRADWTDAAAELIAITRARTTQCASQPDGPQAHVYFAELAVIGIRALDMFAAMRDKSNTVFDQYLKGDSSGLVPLYDLLTNADSAQLVEDHTRLENYTAPGYLEGSG